MKRHRFSRLWAEGLLVAIALCGLFSDFLAPNSPRELDLQHAYAPPTSIRHFDSQGRFKIRPFIYGSDLVDPFERKYAEKAGQDYPLRFFSSGWEYQFLGLFPASIHLVQSSPEARLLLLGADELGRDVFSRLLSGTRTSLLVVAIGLALYMLIGVSVGALSGSVGGWVDGSLMRLSEFALALPAVYVLLALRSLLPLQEMSFLQALFLSVGTIAAVAWPPMARGVRGLILQLANTGYVEAARSMGAGPWHIFRRHMVPALIPYVLTQAVLAAPVFILGEALLSYLGVGFHSDYESWGTMLALINRPIVMTRYWWMMVPLGMVVITLFCLNAVAAKSGSRPIDRITF